MRKILNSCEVNKQVLLYEMYNTLRRLKHAANPVTKEIAKATNALGDINRYRLGLFNVEDRTYCIKHKLVREIREYIKAFIKCDPLEERSNENRRGNDRLIYYSNTNDPTDITRYSDNEHTVQHVKDCKGYSFYLPDSCDSYSYKRFYPIEFWVDDFMNCVREGTFQNLHSKFEYYRVDDVFYKKKDYLLYQGTPYKRTEWALENDKLIDLKKSILISTNKNAYPNTSAKFQTYMTLDNEEEFKDIKDIDIAGREFLDFSIEPINNKRLFSSNFYSTMLKVGKMRLHNGSDDMYIHLVLDKEMVKNLTFDISNAHKRCFDYLKEQLDKWNSRHEIGRTSSRYQDANKAVENITIRVRHTANLSNSLINQLIKETFPDRLTMGINEFCARLDVVKEILKEEDKYAKRTTKNK